MDTKQIIEEAHAVIGLAKSLIERLEAELAEAEKPELVHLDFGGSGNGKWIKLFDEIHWIGQHKQSISGLDDKEFINEVKGNLLSVLNNLKALTEPLTQFTTDVYSYRIDSKDYPGQPIRMAGNHHVIAEVEEHILKLRRLVATAKRQKHDN